MRRTKKEILAGENPQSSKLIGNNTVEWIDENGERRIRLHRTDIIHYKGNGDIVLSSGGWKTVTTKERLNRFLSRWSIWQEKSVWYICRKGEWDKKHVFQDGVILSGDEIHNAGKDVKKLLKLKNKVNKYANDFIKALLDKKISLPSPGDCWNCLLNDEKEKIPVGELFNDPLHIVNHIREKYFVPSLLFRAIEVFGVSQFAKSHVWSLCYVASKEQDRPKIDDPEKESAVRSWVNDSPWANSVTERQVKSALKRYLYRQLGLAS